ncbi:MAG: hypothetical protein KIT62_07305 [Cyclobacteriaceae bacterium]|nr:hypothetical protein [Cyclobacteriaceae bacterium]
MKRVTLYIIAITILGACKKNVADNDNSNSSSNLETSVSFKANGTLISFNKDADDSSQFPSFMIQNSPVEGLIVQFNPSQDITLQFTGPYVENSSLDFTEGEMSYSESSEEYNSTTEDDCTNDSFRFHIQKQSTGLDYLPNMARFTGTFSGLLVSREEKLDPDDPYSPTCLGPEVKITDGSFSVIGLNF